MDKIPEIRMQVRSLIKQGTYTLYILKMQYMAIWQGDSGKAITKNMKASRDLYETFTPLGSKNPREVFLNYRDIDIGTNSKGSIGFALGHFNGNVKRL